LIEKRDVYDLLKISSFIHCGLVTTLVLLVATPIPILDRAGAEEYLPRSGLKPEACKMHCSILTETDNNMDLLPINCGIECKLEQQCNVWVGAVG
jgi:hypothetical protein